MTEAELVAVLSALAAVRRGDRVAAVGAGDRTVRALLAASAGDTLAGADAAVVVAGSAYDVPAALLLLGPAGRLVALAADRDAARRAAQGAGLDLRHVIALDGSGAVAWSGVRRPAGT